MDFTPFPTGDGLSSNVAIPAGQALPYWILIRMVGRYVLTNGLSQADALYQNREWTIPDVASEVGHGFREQHGGVASADLDNDGDRIWSLVRIVHWYSSEDETQ